jgi:ATP-dependent DNA helicase RecQ
MEQYGRTGKCLMEFLLQQLDDPGAESCGRCQACAGTSPVVELDAGVVAKAREHLRWAELMVEPRLQWPSGMTEPKGRIPEELRLQPGRALSVLNDGGWGGLVKKGLEAGEFSDALVSAAAELAGKRWRPDPPPTWVTCVPSSGVSPVSGFTERLAAALGLPFRPVVVKTRETKPQMELENSHQQLRNVWDAFAVEGAPGGEAGAARRRPRRLTMDAHGGRCRAPPGRQWPRLALRPRESRQRLDDSVRLPAATPSNTHPRRCRTRPRQATPHP